MGRQYVAGCRDVAVLRLVGGIEQGHHGVALRLQPHLVLFQAGLMDGCALLDEYLVVGLKFGHEVVNLLRGAVVVRILETLREQATGGRAGQLSQPGRVKLIVCSHIFILFVDGLMIIRVSTTPVRGFLTVVRPPTTLVRGFLTVVRPPTTLVQSFLTVVRPSTPPVQGFYAARRRARVFGVRLSVLAMASEQS